MLADVEESIWIKPSKAFLKLKQLWHITPEISDLILYNQNDVSCTVGVFASMWQWYRKIPIEHIAGLYHRSIPFLPLARDWFDRVNEIDNEFTLILSQMFQLVNMIEMEYLDHVGVNDWDGFDWKKWGKTCEDKSKVGRYKWLGDTGLSLSLIHI